MARIDTGTLSLSVVVGIAATVVLGAAAVVVGVTVSRGPRPFSCPGVAIFGVRGSAQDYSQSDSGMGPEVSALATEIQRRLPSSLKVETIGVPYPAASPIGAIFNSSDHNFSPYNSSVIEGASLLQDGRSDFTSPGAMVGRCQRTAIVLAGISQGAQVITTALSQAPTQALMRTHLTAAILFASPVRISGQSINVGAQNQDGVLTNPGSSQPFGHAASVPNDLWRRTQSYCLQDDPICDNTDIGFLSPVLPPPFNIVNHRPMIHSSYAKSLFVLEAAAFVVGKISQTNGQPSRTRDLPSVPSRFVALGDSYSSGEGANDYFDGTKNGDDTCHRSGLGWPSLLGAPKSDFKACSGSTTADLQTRFDNESSQLSALTSSTDLVTITAGGDDIGFSQVLDNCVDKFIPLNHSRDDRSCRFGRDDNGRHTFGINDALNALPAYKANMLALLTKIRSQSPDARILVLGYPRLFPVGGYAGDSCNGIHTDWQNWLNDAGDSLNQAIQDAVNQSGVAEYVDVDGAFNGHEVCGRPDGAAMYVNDLQVHCPFGNGSISGLGCSESFHPTPDGYLALRDIVFDHLDHDLLNHLGPSNPTVPPPVLATKLITFQPWVPHAPTGISVPMPGAVLTQATGKCDGGSPHDPGRNTAFRCTTDPNALADPCFANFNSGDPASSLLCSTDPTTMNLVELDQAGGQLPMRNANTEDPNAPPWFLILSDGLKCHIVLGTNTLYLPYDCSGGTSTTAPDRSKPAWTVREGKNISPSSRPSSPPVEVIAAYR